MDILDPTLAETTRASISALGGHKPRPQNETGHGYTENNTENNFTANIDHYHADNDGTDVDDWRKHNNINEGVSRDYVSKETLEDSR